MYVQVRNFDIVEMGKKEGWCLQNVRLGFGITKGYYASAKIDMETQRANGTLHSISTIPKNCAVPVFCDTDSPYEHVVVYDRGKVYSDGKLIPAGLSAFKCFGWGELIDNVRVVRYENSKKPLPEIVNEVIAGKWGNGYERKMRLHNAGYDYPTIQRLVNEALQTNNDLIYSVQAGDTLTAIALKFNTSIDKLAKDNHIKDVNFIMVGQKLVIK